MELFDILLLLQVIWIIISIFSFIFIVFDKSSENQQTVVLLNISNLVTLIGYLFEMTAHTKEVAILSQKIEYTGIIFTMTLLFLLICGITENKLPKAVKIGIVFADFLFLPFIYTMELHDWVFKSLSYMQDGLFPHLHREFGLVFYLYIVYNFAFIFMSICFLVQYYRVTGRKTRPEMKALPIVFISQVLMVVYYFVKEKYDFTYNPSSFLLLLQLLLVIFMVYRFRMFDSVEVAKDDIVDNLNEGYCVIDAGRKLLFANDVAYSIFPDLKYSGSRAATINMIYRSNKKSLNINGKYYAVSVVPFYSKGTLKGYNLWIFDKTEEQLATQKLIELKEQAEQANQAKTMFLANMSHEIRTPMNAILGTAEIILREKIYPQVEEEANSIKNAGMILLSIINDILDFSKIESGKMSAMEIEYHPGLLIRDIARETERKLNDKNIEFQYYVKETIPSMLRGDETHVRQIFTNILNNAVKYTKEGYVRMNVDWEQQGKDLALIRVSVEDTGCGISEEGMTTLFDSFQRADMIKNRTIEGTGLGLAISKRLVESMGGTIHVKSTYGEGSVFSFFIMQRIVDITPMGNIEELHSLDINGHDKEETFIAPKARILAVDDNITNTKVIQGIFKMYKIDIDIATSGNECLKKVHEKNYHMIFMDQMMPIMDGIETAERIRMFPEKEKKNIPIIALTANAIRGSRELFIEKGFQDYISKPIDLKILERILLTYLPAEYIEYVDRENPDVSLGGVISIPGVNVDKGLANYGDSRNRYIQILKYFYEDGESQIERIRTQISNNKIDEYVYEVHALKGLAGGIGAAELEDCVRMQEKYARNNEVDNILSSVDEMIEKYEMLLANIKFVLLENGISLEDDIVITEETLSEEEFIWEIKELVQSLDMLEQQEAEKRMNHILSTRLEEDIRKKLENAKTSIKDFEYEQAISLLEEFL